MKVNVILFALLSLFCSPNLFCDCNQQINNVGGSLKKVGSNSHSTKLDAILSNTKTSSASAHKTGRVQQPHHHTMSFTTLVINILADLCPHGMLPLAYGLMKGPTGLVPAFALLLLFGSISAYTMTSYATLARDTQSSTIGEIWGKIVNEKTKSIADVSLFALCFGCCVFYSAFIGDIFSALASAVGIKGLLSKRYAILAVISSIVLLPLCELDDISALSFSSILGVGGIFYTFLFHIFRYFDCTYAPTDGEFYLKLSTRAQPEFPSPLFTTWEINKDTLVLVNMLGVAFLAHYNAINYYKELDQATIPKYSRAVGIGFSIAMFVFSSMMIFGYLLFGMSVKPLILNNFHRTDDVLATFARLATGLAITFAYPLMFAGLKTSMKSMLFSSSTAAPALSVSTATKPVSTATTNKGKQQLSKDKTHIAAAVVPIIQNKSKIDMYKQVAIPAVLTAITAIAIKCGEEDVSLVLGIVGSILGCTVAYILPGFLQLKYMAKQQRQSIVTKGATSTATSVSKLEKLKSWLLILLGTVFSILGVWVTLESAGEPPH